MFKQSNLKFYQLQSASPASQSQVLPQHQRSRTQTQYKSFPRVSDYHSWHHLSCSSHGHEDELPLGFQPSAADTRRPKLLRYHIQYHSDYVPMLPQPQLVREVYSAISQPVLLLTLNMELNRCIARASPHSSLSVRGLCFAYVTPLPDVMIALTPTSLEPRLWGVPPLPLP